jgi:hypothetical protein
MQTKRPSGSEWYLLRRRMVPSHLPPMRLVSARLRAISAELAAVFRARCRDVTSTIASFSSGNSRKMSSSTWGIQHNRSAALGVYRPGLCQVPVSDGYKGRYRA